MYCLLMSPVSYSHVLMGAHVSTDVGVNDTPPTVCSRLSHLAAGVSWYGPEFITVVGRLSCMREVH